MRERVLVIEDEDRILDFLRRGLTYEGYRVDTAADGPTGMALARETPPDVVILDWMLPGLDGLEVCRRLRAAGDVPILMLTAKEAVSDRVQGLDAGADDYLVKPFEFDELLARIRALLRRAHPEAVLVDAQDDGAFSPHEGLPGTPGHGEPQKQPLGPPIADAIAAGHRGEALLRQGAQERRLGYHAHPLAGCHPRQGLGEDPATGRTA